MIEYLLKLCRDELANDKVWRDFVKKDYPSGDYSESTTVSYHDGKIDAFEQVIYYIENPDELKKDYPLEPWLL